MKIELRCHYWPATPHLREVKVVVDGKVLVSEFLNQSEIWGLAKQCRYLDYALMDVGNSIEL